MQDPKSPATNMGNENHNGGTATWDEPRPESTGMQDQASELKDKAGEKASEYGAKLQETADAGIDRAADGLEKAAGQLRTRAEDGGGVQEKVGVRVADGLDKTSQYLREHEAQEIWTDVEQFVKDHPMQAAVGAAVAGYVVAKMMK